MGELQRIFRMPRTYIILVLLCVMNLALFAGFCHSQAAETEHCATQIAEQTAAYRETGYHAYLQQISGQSAGQTLLGSLGKQSDFIQRNRALTIADYEHLQGITLEDGADAGIEAMLQYHITDYLLLIAPLLLILELLTVQTSACGDMLRSTRKGRVPLLLWRMLAVFLLCLLSVLLIWGGNIAYGHFFFGDPVYSRAVQSIPAFQHCVWRVTVGEFLLLWGILKAAAVFCITLFIWLILSIFQPVMAILIALPALGGQFLCYTLMDAAAAVNHLKYCNVFAILESGFFFTDYNNLNWFGHPLGMLASALIALGVIFSAVAALLILFVGYKHPVRIGYGVQHWFDRLQKWASSHFGIHTVFAYEGKKLLLGQKGLLIVIVTAAMTVSVYQGTKIFVPTLNYWDEAYEKFGGAVTPEKMQEYEDYLITLEENVERAQAALDRSMELQLPMHWINEDEGRLAQAKHDLEYFTAFRARIEPLDVHRQQSGQEVWLIPQEGYHSLFGKTAAAERFSLLLLLYTIFISAGIGAYENRFGAAPLLRSTPHGRLRRVAYKGIWLMLLVLPMAWVLYSCYSACVASNTPLEYGMAPVQSLDGLRDFGLPVTVDQFYGLWMTARCILMTLFAFLVAVVGSRSKNPRNALLLCLIIFFLPAALAQTGVPVLEKCSFSHPLSLFVA
ncbi:MAG: hypothetical protein ACI4J3_04325 [Oscillospiraceae bacterium]